MHMKTEKRPFTCVRGGLTIRGYSWLPEGDRLPAIILSHGFLSCGRELEQYARQLSAEGYACFTFDFNGGGPRCQSEGKTWDMSVLTEAEDLRQVLTYVQSLGRIDRKRISLMGRSQGGVVSALVAARYRTEIDRLILFYPALCIPDDARSGKMQRFTFDPANLPERIVQGKMVLGRCYPETVLDMDIFEAISGYDGPVLLVHGTADPIVNFAYSKMAWLQYTTGQHPGTVPKEAPSTHELLSAPPSLPKGTAPDPQKQLLLIGGAGHGFWAKDNLTAMKALKLFLKGYTEVLTADVRLTGRVQQTRGLRTHLELPFTGNADSPWFRGVIQEGAKDAQDWFFLSAQSKCADYTIQGTDYTGAPCTVHIVNRGSGAAWKPTVTTDSTALSFLNRADCEALLESRKTGPIVRIYCKVSEGGTV